MKRKKKMRKNGKKIISFLFLLPFFVLRLGGQNSLAGYVDPLVGTDGHGHTFPGATVPFGMVQLSPDTRVDGSWDGCGGYHYSDSLIYGFSHTHLSGTGCSDYGDILFMPASRYPSLDNKKYRSSFSHKNETAGAGYYSVELGNKVKAELTASARCGFHRYTFPKQNFGWIVLDLLHRDKTLQSEINIIDKTHISGFRRSEAWAKDQHCYFYAEFSQPFTVGDAREFFKKKDPVMKGMESGVVLTFNLEENKTVMVRVGISFVSEEGAKLNLESEIAHWEFEKTMQEAKQSWETELSKILVEGEEEKKKIFYTALYHCMIQPNLANDVNGNYRGRDNRIHKAEGHQYYTVFSLWDTFRGEHPLFTIIDRKRTTDFIKTFLLQYRQGGRLPVWELASNETDCMIGYHSVSVITDAITKGIRDFDLKLALEAMERSANWDHLGLPVYAGKHFLEAEDEHESVSKTLEYAYDDWCIAQVAQMLNKKDDYIDFMRRAGSWKNLFDPETGFMRPRRNGGWLSPFDPREVNNHFTEGNSWQYSFFVPHDVNGLIGLSGGEEAFEAKLDQLFSEESKTTGREQADITGLIGQYAHGNEPSHHMAYLYNYIGKPYKTQQLVKRICDEMYKTGPAGLIGNEDCGQMSAWYVLSAIGFYPVCPGSGFFDIGFPAFDKVTIQLENGKQFVIDVKMSSRRKNEKCRIGNVMIDGNSLGWTRLSYEKIMNGSTMEITLTDDPVSWWGKFFTEVPPLPEKDYQEIWRAPAIVSSSQTFEDSLEVEIMNYEPGKIIVYAVEFPGDSSKNTKPAVYTGPFRIKNSARIYSWIRPQGSLLESDRKKAEDFISSYFHKIPNNWSLEIKSKYNPQYTAGGDKGIIDGLRADANWRKGGWQGYQSQDMEAVIDLKKETLINEVGGGFLQDTRSWIVMPRKVEISFSADGRKFSKPVVIMNDVKDSDYEVRIRDFIAKLPKSVMARFVKVKAVNYGKLPVWHQGAGGDAFIFSDELIIR